MMTELCIVGNHKLCHNTAEEASRHSGVRRVFLERPISLDTLHTGLPETSVDGTGVEGCCT